MAIPCVLNIAGVRFVLPETPHATTAWPEAFHDFVCEAGATDLVCKICCPGPDEALTVEPPQPGSHWQFQVEGGQFVLTRRAVDGVPLWRILAPLSFDSASVSWHPQRFSAVYGDFVKSWTFGFGLALLVLRLRACGGVVFHGSTAVLDGRGIICTGVSGTGKSTIARLLHAAGAAVLSDERPVVRQWPMPVCDAQLAATADFRVYGSPWPSSAGFALNAWAPLRRIYFLEHGDTNRLTPLTPREAFNRIIQVATIPWQDATLFDPCLKTIETLLRLVPCAVLSFRPTPEVVDLIRQDR